MTDTYTPAVGDHVLMPKAPKQWRPQRVYTVDDLTQTGIRLKNGTDTWSIGLNWAFGWGITRAYSHAEITQATSSAGYMVNCLSEDGGDAANDMLRDALDRLAAPSYGRDWRTHGEVTSALNEAANAASDAVEGETSDTIRNDSARDLAVNAATYLLDHPAADLHDAIVAEYTDVDVYFDDLDEDEPEPPKGSEAWNDALYETVTGWIS